MTDLRLDWCSHEAALFAVRAWHYSASLPAGKAVRIGAWEDGRFIGAVVFSRGACQHIGRPFGLRQSQVCELTRVALDETHQTPTSRIAAIALRLLRRQSPGLRLLVSFADPQQGHVGTLYQACGWWYLGETHRECLLRVHGRLLHPRTVGSRYGTRAVPWLRQHVDPDAERIVTPAKHRYVLPLDDAMRTSLAPLARPYPSRDREADSGRPVPAGRGGASPTRSLQSLPEAAHA